MKNLLFFCSILLSVIFISCKKNNSDKPQVPSAVISININDISLPDIASAATGSVSVDFISNVEWSILLSNTKAIPD